MNRLHSQAITEQELLNSCEPQLLIVLKSGVSAQWVPSFVQHELAD